MTAKKPASLKELTPEFEQLLKGSVTGALATVDEDCDIQITPVWVGTDGTYLTVNTARGRVKDRNLRTTRKAAVLLLNPKNPYHYLSVSGNVVDIIEEDDKSRGHLATENIDAMAEQYINQRPYPFRDPKGEVRVLYKIEPTQILTYGNP